VTPGGPLAGSLKSSGGFAPSNSNSNSNSDSDSEMSVRQVEAAAGTKGSPGVVLLLATPRGSSASASRIAGVCLARTLRSEV